MSSKPLLAKAIWALLLPLLLSVPTVAQTPIALPDPGTSKMISLDRALHEIRERFKIQVAYDPEAVAGIEVLFPATPVPLEALLSQLLQNTGLEYRFLKADQVLIRNFGSSTPGVPEGIITLSGYVADKNGETRLSFASVFHPETQTGTISDEDGHFQLVLTGTTDTSLLEISYLGYTSVHIPIWKLLNGVENTISLEPQVVDFVPVLVKEKLPGISKIQPESGTRIKLTAFDYLPSLSGLSDPLRKLQFLPGIMASEDLSAGLKIRGAKSSENMVLLDGIPLIKVDHFLGIFSAVNGAIVDQIDLYKNAFPVEYGGRTAGLIDIKTRSINQAFVKGGIQLNNLSADAFLQLPLSRSMGISLAGRTTLDNAANSGLFDYINPSKNLEQELENNFRSVFAADPDFQFHDFNAKWSWIIDSTFEAEANYFLGEDIYQYSFQKNFLTFRNQKPIQNTEQFNENSQWKNSGYSFLLEKKWNEDWSSKLVLGGSGYRHNNGLQSNVFRTGTHFSDTLQIGFVSEHEVLTRDLNWKNVWQVSATQQLSLGYQFTGYSIQSIFSQTQTRYFTNIQKVGLHTTFAQWQRQFDHSWNLSAALRSTWNRYNNKLYLSPRFNLSRQVGNRLILKGFTGIDHQFLQEASHENQFGRTASFWILGGEAPFPVARSTQWMTGFTVPGNILRLDVEFYQNHTNGIVEYALSRPGLSAETPGLELISRFRFFDGERLTSGMDLSLEKSTGSLTGLLSYTLSKTIHTFPGINFGEAFPAQDDRRHQLQFTGNYQLRNWNLGFSYVFASGRPYLDLSKIDEPEVDRGNIRFPDNQNYLPDYHRMDLGINYRFTWNTSSLELGAQIFNLFNIRNVGYVQYLYALDDEREVGKPPKTGIFGTETNLLPRTFSFSAQWKF